MEASLAAAALLNPVGLAVLAVVIFVAVSIGSQTGHPNHRISRRKLTQGFAGLILGALVVAAASSYVSPEEASRVGVQDANYLEALSRQFATLGVLLVFASVIGCAIVGIPLVVALASRGLATIPIVVAASVPVSLAFGFAVGLFGLGSPSLFQEVAILLATHAFLSLAFAASAQFPWRRRQVTAA